VYNFYGTFHLGALYDMKNFSNMLVNDFFCKEELENGKESTNQKVLILSDDVLALYDMTENNIGRLEFWATLYSLLDLQVNKMTKVASMSFYNDVNNLEKKINLKIDNILFFREALVKRMTSLKVKSESKRLYKGQNAEKRLNDKDIEQMPIADVIKSIDVMVSKINTEEVNYYVVNTFMKLVGRVSL
jgi:hypothetical protein